MDEKKRIGIALPLGKVVDGRFLDSILNVLKENISQYEIEVITHFDCYIPRSRNELVKKAKLSKCDYIWFIDSDHIIPNGTLNHLLKIMKEKKSKMVSGLYFTRTPPIIPVIRKLEDDAFECIFDYKGIMEVDGVGFGCCLIDLTVFDNLEEPYFNMIYKMKYGFQSFLGEDLYFCKNIREKGIKIHVDTDLVIPHIGGIIGSGQYEPYKKSYIRSEQIKQDLIDDLHQFTNLEKEEIKLRIMNGVLKHKEEWEEQNPSTPEGRYLFYKTSEWSKYELASWHLGQRLNFDMQLLETIKKEKPEKDIRILDYGCGIGQNSLLLAKEGYTNITLHDLNLSFAEYRFKKHNLNYDTEIKGRYDVIFCFDVLEHLDKEEFIETIKLFKSLRKEDTKILITAPFGDNGLHPMHFDADDEKIKMIKELMPNAETR